MLALNKKTDYALVALSLLAKLPDGVLSARSIAKECGLPLAILTNILKTLTHAGVVVSERGANGGYRLARAPELVDLHEVITAMEGPIQFVRCLNSNGRNDADSCGLEPSCPVRLPGYRINERLRQFLQSTPLSELVEPQSEPARVDLNLGTDQRRESDMPTTERGS